YVWVITVRAFEFYVDFHSFIVSLFALAVFLVHHTLYITFLIRFTNPWMQAVPQNLYRAAMYVGLGWGSILRCTPNPENNQNLSPISIFPDSQARSRKP
ncbi:MAG: hypothetical protein LBH43_19965, partial [Treponema sp.]|nr:hypothetical protein [Treponema sp.]